MCVGFAFGYLVPINFGCFLRLLDNTFIGTSLAGALLAFLGLQIYRVQKKLDIEYSKRSKIQELATSLLTHINVSIQDYLGQISIHDGTNPAAKALFDKINSISPNFNVGETTKKFNIHIEGVNRAFNKLSTPLALTGKHQIEIELLVKNVPLIMFLLSTTSTLSGLQKDTLKDLSGQIKGSLDNIRPSLERIINE